MKKVVAVVLMMILLLPCMVQAETLSIDSNEVKSLNEKYKLTKDEGGTHIYNDHVYIYNPDAKKVNSVENMSNLNFVILTGILGNMKYTEEERQTLPNGNAGSALYYVVTKEDYNKAFANIFGPDVSVKNITEYSNTSLACGKIYIYNAEKDNYEAYQGCGGLDTGVYKKGYIKDASLEKDSIIVNLKYYIYDKNNKTISSFDNKNKNMPVKDGEDQSEVSSKYNDYLYTSKFTFKKASDNNYYFYSVENMDNALEYKNTNSNGNSKTTVTKKVSNPNTADKNVVLLLGTGIILTLVIFYSGKKLLIRK